MVFNETFAVKRPQRAPDGRGGFTTTYAEIASERGRMSMASANQQLAGAQIQERVTHVLFTRAGADIARNDLVVGPRSGSMLVLGVRRPSKGDHLEIDCREYQAGN